VQQSPISREQLANSIFTWKMAMITVCVCVHVKPNQQCENTRRIFFGKHFLATAKKLESELTNKNTQHTNMRRNENNTTIITSHSHAQLNYILHAYSKLTSILCQKSK